jgi:Protein of unknown function (DUF1236)
MMRVRFILTLLAATAMPAAAWAQANAVGGAVGGAVVGGVVGGPVGAAVGAAVGGTVGAATEPPPDAVVTYAEREDVPSVTVRERVVVGESLPETVIIHRVPQHEKYACAVVNKQRIIVDPQSRKVIKIIER